MARRSPPAQNCPPAPVRMSARMSPLATSSRSTAASSVRSVMSSALRAAGRFRVSVAMPSATVKSRAV
jgi:hypothetical protein